MEDYQQGRERGKRRGRLDVWGAGWRGDREGKIGKTVIA